MDRRKKGRMWGCEMEGGRREQLVGVTGKGENQGGVREK